MSFLRSVLAAAVLATAASAQVPVGYYENIGTIARQDIATVHGIHSHGANYDFRKSFFDLLDIAWSPTLAPGGGIAYHPFLYAEVSHFTRAFLLESWDQAIAQMDAAAANPPADGVRVYALGGNSVIVETFIPTGPGGALAPFRVSVDFSDLTWIFSGALHPGTVTSSDVLARINAFADRIDSNMITHQHPDHFSVDMINAMNQRGKPTIMPNGMIAAGLQYGFSWPTAISAGSGVYPVSPYIEVAIHTGYQYDVECNVYFINFLHPSPTSQLGDGVTFIHFGDNEELVGLGTLITQLVGTGFIKDTVITANLGALPQAMIQQLSPDVRLQTPAYEFSHFAGEGGWFGANYPIESQFNPAQRLPLFWGESFHWPSDLPF